MTPSPQQQALLAQARQALGRGQAAEALKYLDECERLGRTHHGVLSRALTLKVMGRLPEALAAMDEALEMEPYDFAALLAKGAILEDLKAPKQAIEVFRNALKIAPARDRCPPGLLAQLNHAAQKIETETKALAQYMQARVAPLRGRLSSEAQDRFDEGLDIYSGLAKPAPQMPLLMHYPRLPPLGFYERRFFPWLEQLEAATPVIVEELTEVLETRFERFAPYIAYPKGAPVNQWKTLNHSNKWTSLFLWNNGTKVEEVCAACPRTAALLETLPMADQEGFAPTAMFSALQPHTHIPAHTGSSNVRLLTHLPLILPGPARFRVGNRTRDWEMGKAWVFDDTIEHEAWNDADGLRVILIFDIWNPFIEDEEKALITEMMAARRDFMNA